MVRSSCSQESEKSYLEVAEAHVLPGSPDIRDIPCCSQKVGPNNLKPHPPPPANSCLLPVFIPFFRGERVSKRETEAHVDIMPSLTFTFPLFQIGVAPAKLPKWCWVGNCVPCVCTLLAFPGMTWAQEKMGQEAKEGKKPSFRFGAFCFPPRVVLPLGGGQKEKGHGENKT